MGDFEKRVVRNAGFIVLARVWFLAVGVFLTPYILKRLGDDQYGIWLLIGAFVGYLGLADFGLKASFVKFVAEYHARGDQHGINGVFTTGLTVYSVLGFIILAIAYPSVGPILNFFTIPQGLEDQARFVLQMGIIVFMLGNIALVYQSMIDGLQRMDISTGISILLSICNLAGSVLVLELGFGIRGLAVNQLITQVIGTALTRYFSHRFYTELRFDLKSTRNYLSTFFRYGLNLQVGNIAGLIRTHFDKLVVNRFIDAAHVTLYEIGSRFPLTLSHFPIVGLSPLIPASSELEIRRGRLAVYEVFSKVSRYLAVVAVLLFMAATVTAQPLIDAWVGPGYDRSVVVMRILCIGYFFNTIAAPASHMVAGIGRPEFLRNAEGISLLLNVVLSILLIKQFGFYGAPIGTSIAMSVADVYCLWVFHRFLERPLFPFLKNTFLKPVLCGLLAGLAAFAVSFILIPYIPGGRLGGLLEFVAAGSVFTVSYFWLILKWKYFDERDTAVLRDHLPFYPALDLAKRVILRRQRKGIKSD